MLNNNYLSEYLIRGDCSYFVCCCCRTKFGWEHQEWCESRLLSEPSCEDCRYYSAGRGGCLHPAKKGREELPYEKDTCSLRAEKRT